MTEQIAVELRVLGHTFRLATTESEKGDLERAAELLNEKYDDFRRKAPRLEIDHYGGARTDARSSCYE